MTECEKWIEAVLRAPMKSIEWWDQHEGQYSEYESMTHRLLAVRGGSLAMIRQLLRAAKEMEASRDAVRHDS